MRKNETNLLLVPPSDKAQEKYTLAKAQEEYTCSVMCANLLNQSLAPSANKDRMVDRYLLRAFHQGERIGIC